MAINNINALVDLEGLNNLNNSDYVSKYYNAGLANQGQRWTNEALLEYKNFNIANLIAFRYYNVNEDIDPYTSIPSYNQRYINKKSYLIIRQKDLNRQFSLDNIYFGVCDPSTIDGYQNILDLETIDEYSFDYISNNDISSILFSKKLWIIKNLYYQIIYDIAYDPKNKEDYEQSLSDEYIHDSMSSYNNLELWIPLDYKFEYICDGINKSVIYGDHKNILVYFEPISIDNLDNAVWKDPNKNGIIFIKTQRKYVKTCVYNFSFTKESEIPTILRSHVLPFIDEENYWWINNAPTPIIAKAEKPTNLNIILAYLHKVGNSNEFRILSGLNNDFDDIINIDYLSSRKVWIKRYNGESFSIICRVPIISKITQNIVDEKIKDNIVKILENSTIILMTKLSKLLPTEDDDIKKEYKDGLITTIWSYSPDKVFDEDTNEFNDYDYISIEKDDLDHNLALDFGEITNFSNLVNFKVNKIEQTAPDNYLNRHIIFDQILKTNKQEIFDTAAYAVLQNIKGNKYNDDYSNNFNFSIRYVNNIIGKPGDLIEKIANTSENRYLKIPSLNNVTRSIYQKIEDNQTKNYREYIPNYDVPTFDLSEVLIKDSNVMNRQNIISFSDSGNAYYAYIGTSFDSYDKSVLHIGTSNIDINLGEYSLIDSINKKNFQTHNTISLDFTYSYLNSYTFIKNDLNVGENIYYNNVIFDKKEFISKNDKTEIISTQIIPKSKYILDESGSIYHIINIDMMISNLNSILRKIENNSIYYNNSDYLYVNIILSHQINEVKYYYKYNDLLYIDNLIKYLGITDQINKIISNTNQIIYNSNGVAKFLVSSNNLLSNNSINITASSDTGISIEVQNVNIIYTGNQLNITYNKKDHLLIIDEYQSHKIKSIWKLPDHI